MDYREIEELIGNEKYEEAYHILEENYEKTKALEDLFYMSNLDLTYLHYNDLDIVYEQFKLLVKLPKKYLPNVLANLILISYECSKIDDCYNYCKLFYKHKLTSLFVDAYYARVCYYKTIELHEADVISTRISKNPECPEEIREICYETLVMLYISEGRKEELKKMINEMYLVLSDVEFVDMMDFMAQLEYNMCPEELTKLAESLSEKYKDASICLRAVSALQLKHADKEALTLAKKMLENTSDEDEQYLLCERIADSYMHLQEEEQFNNFLVDLREKYNWNEENMDDLKIEYYFSKNSYESISYGISLLKKIIMNNMKEYQEEKQLTLSNFADKMANKACELECSDILKDTIDFLEQYETRLDLDLNSTRALYYYTIGDFDQSEKYFTLAYKSQTIHFLFYTEYMRLIAKKSQKFEKIYMKNFENDLYKNLDWAKREYANCYLHGQYGFPIDKEKAIELSKTALASRIKSKMSCNCFQSMYASSILDTNPEEAILQLEKGVLSLREGREYCECCYPILSYCYAMGIGVERDEEKAWNLVQEAIILKNGAVNENTYAMYAYLSLKLNRDIKECYDFLITHFQRRYEVTKEYMLILLCERLGMNPKPHKIKFDIAMKHCSIGERNHYKTNPTIPYINNI